VSEHEFNEDSIFMRRELAFGGWVGRGNREIGILMMFEGCLRIVDIGEKLGNEKLWEDLMF
jgi:hypothetical protein